MNEKIRKKKSCQMSDLFFSHSEDTVGDMDKRPQLPNQTPRGAQWTFLDNLPGGSFRIWPRSLYFSIGVRLIFSTFRGFSHFGMTPLFLALPGIALYTRSSSKCIAEVSEKFD